MTKWVLRVKIVGDNEELKELYQKQIDKLVKEGAPGAVDPKNPQKRQVIATAGKIRIKVDKGNLK